MQRVISILLAIVVVMTALTAYAADSVYGQVVLDMDGNRIVSPGDVGLAGVEVRLVDGNIILHQTTTEGDGTYLLPLTDVPNGEYVLFVVGHPSYTQPVTVGEVSGQLEHNFAIAAQRVFLPVVGK